MELEEIVSNLKLSVELKQHGAPQDNALCYWTRERLLGAPDDYLLCLKSNLRHNAYQEVIAAAFTIPEMAAIITDSLQHHGEKKIFHGPIYDMFSETYSVKSYKRNGDLFYHDNYTIAFSHALVEAIKHKRIFLNKTKETVTNG